MPAADGKPQLELCNCFALKKAARQIARLYDDHLAPTGLRITQFLILAVLNDVKSAPVNVLAERLDTERTAMGKMTTVLERDGLVRIAPAPEDARTRVVELTREGTRLYEKAAPLWSAAQRHVEKLNSKERVDALRAELAELVLDDAQAA